ADLVDPLLGRLVRRMGAAGHVVEEERLIRSGRVKLSQAGDGVVRQVCRQIVAGLSDPRENLGSVLVKPWGPLVGFSAHEAIEVTEPHAFGPLIEGARRTVLVARRVVVLAEPGRGVSVLLENSADRSALGSDDAVVTGIARGLLGDDAKAHRV